MFAMTLSVQQLLQDSINCRFPYWSGITSSKGNNKMISICNLFFLAAVAVLEQHVNSFPLQVRLLSEISGQFVRVHFGGDVTADASQSGKGVL